jgi:uncharacterized Zn ribbon protein
MTKKKSKTPTKKIKSKTKRKALIHPCDWCKIDEAYIVASDGDGYLCWDCAYLWKKKKNEREDRNIRAYNRELSKQKVKEVDALDGACFFCKFDKSSLDIFYWSYFCEDCIDEWDEIENKREERQLRAERKRMSKNKKPKEIKDDACRYCKDNKYFYDWRHISEFCDDCFFIWNKIEKEREREKIRKIKWSKKWSKKWSEQKVEEDDASDGIIQ